MKRLERSWKIPSVLSRLLSSAKRVSKGWNGLNDWNGYFLGVVTLDVKKSLTP